MRKPPVFFLLRLTRVGRIVPSFRRFISSFGRGSTLLLFLYLGQWLVGLFQKIHPFAHLELPLNLVKVSAIQLKVIYTVV